LKYYSILCTFNGNLWVWNLVSDPKRKTYIDGVSRRVLRRNLDLREMKLKKAGENYIVRSFIICTLHQMVFRLVKLKTVRWADT
jgi:hypothetical protein